MTPKIAVLLVVAAQLVVTPALAAKKKRVVILTFAGPSGAAARGGLAAALGRKATQIPPATFSSAAQQLGADVDAAAGIAQTCSKVRCDAVIKGSVRKKGRRFTLTVTVHNGGTGEAIGRRAATVRGPRRVRAAGGAVGAQCVSLVAQGKWVKGAAQPARVAKADKPAPPPKPEPAPPKVAAKGDTSDVPVYKPEPEAEEKPKKGRKKGDDEEEEEEGVSKRASAGPGGLGGLFDVSIAMGLSMRSCSVTGDDPVNNIDYEGSMYPEFTLRADFYPMTFFLKNFARNIGLAISYTRHMSISTKTLDPNDPPVDTSSWELLLDMNVRWQFWAKPTSPVVIPFFGWGMRDFWLDDNKVLAAMSYRFVRFGLDGRVPLGTPYAALHAGFDVRVYTGGLGRARYFWGERSGGLGWAVRGGAYGRFPFGLFYFLDVEYLRFSAQFDGLGQGVQASEIPELDRVMPMSSTDSFIRFWVGAGYAM